MFEPGLNKVFPDLDNENDFPTATISMHQSPDGSMFWLMGQLGEIRKVRVCVGVVSMCLCGGIAVVTLYIGVGVLKSPDGPTVRVTDNLLRSRASLETPATTLRYSNSYSFQRVVHHELA